MLDYIRQSDYITIVVSILILAFVFKITALAILIYYEYDISNKMSSFKSIIENNFNDLIDIETISSAFKDNVYNELFIQQEVNSVNSIFTKQFIISLMQKNRIDNSKIIKDYLNNSENPYYLDKLITAYDSVKFDIDNNLLKVDYSQEIIDIIDNKRKKVNNIFAKISSYIKKQQYPINVIIDTLIILAVIIAIIGYILYYKIYKFLVIIVLIISVFMLIFYKSNTLILIITFACLYIAYFFKLYQIIKSTQSL